MALVLFSGCDEAGDPQIELLRERFVVTTAISGETSVSSIRKVLQQEDASKSVPVIIRGQISAGDLPPWEPGKAAFALTDTTGHDGDTEHDPHTCPFCSRNIQNYMANIYFRDESGNTIAIDSRKLFDVKEKQTVILQGQGMMAEDGTLEVDAQKMYIRP